MCWRLDLFALSLLLRKLVSRYDIDVYSLSFDRSAAYVRPQSFNGYNELARPCGSAAVPSGAVC